MQNVFYIVRKIESFKKITKLATLTRDLKRFGFGISFYERIESLSEYFNISILNCYALKKLILLKNFSEKKILKK